ncbi:hypothetical protein M885DRAFT_612012 [Pelagophyceae sp. CCMP2097]|nr:hypothetical protein M885DRAFT_612012 [Pelagophyceae sp. CCMP2097]
MALAGLEGVRALRDSLGGGDCPEDAEAICDALCANVMASEELDEDSQKLANASAQCLANLAARGRDGAVWAALQKRRPCGGGDLGAEASAFERSLTRSCKRYVAAAAHNCIRRDAKRAAEFCGRANAVHLLVDAAINCESLRAFAGLGGDEAARCDLQGDAEWLYLLLRALLGQGCAVALVAAVSSAVDDHFTRVRREFLLALTFAAAVDDAHGDALQRAIDVACVAVGLMEGITQSERSIALQIVAELTARDGDGAIEAADAFVAAGALQLAARTLSAPDESHAEGDVVSALAIVANVCHVSAAARNGAREAEVIPLVLCRCTIVRRNPLQREWAVFACRSLCTDNDANRELIAGYTAQAALPPDETLLAAGVEGVTLDEATRRPVLQRRQRGPAVGADPWDPST